MKHIANNCTMWFKWQAKAKILYAHFQLQKYTKPSLWQLIDELWKFKNIEGLRLKLFDYLHNTTMKNIYIWHECAI